MALEYPDKNSDKKTLIKNPSLPSNGVLKMFEQMNHQTQERIKEAHTSSPWNIVIEQINNYLQRHIAQRGIHDLRPTVEKRLLETIHNFTQVNNIITGALEIKGKIFTVSFQFPGKNINGARLVELLRNLSPAEIEMRIQVQETNRVQEVYAKKASTIAIVN